MFMLSAEIDLKMLLVSSASVRHTCPCSHVITYGPVPKNNKWLTALGLVLQIPAWERPGLLCSAQNVRGSFVNTWNAAG